ncbi:MAG: hypothetical protein IVW57_11835 [Ktedonobacterales bacterium]|nr:hypothetical protein [Ktedonobacterales bacterium]
MTYERAEGGNQTMLTLTHSISSTQQDVDSMVENGWKPILQTLKQLVESSK